MEEKDVVESEEQINLVQSSLQGVNINQDNYNEKANLINKFSNSVILGDSRAESILSYLMKS